MEDLQSTTAILKKHAPFWGWLRSNFTLPMVLAVGGIIGAFVFDGILLNTGMSQLQKDFAEFKKEFKASQPQTISAAKLEQHVKDQDAVIEDLQDRLNQASQVAHEPRPKLESPKKRR